MFKSTTFLQCKKSPKINCDIDPSMTVVDDKAASTPRRCGSVISATYVNTLDSVNFYVGILITINKNMCECVFIYKNNVHLPELPTNLHINHKELKLSIAELRLKQNEIIKTLR